MLRYGHVIQKQLRSLATNDDGLSFLLISHPLTAPHSDNALNHGGAEAIRVLLESALTLKTIKLNNTGVGPTGGKVCVGYHEFVFGMQCGSE